MPARTGCCCPGQTLWRVDSSGNVVWSANYFADYGDKISAHGWGLIFADQDESGYSYQGGSPTVKVDPDTTHTQPTIDNLRQYNSSGVKQWGWSPYPTGFIDTARSGANMKSMSVSKHGTTASTHYHYVPYGYSGTYPLKIVYGVDHTGSQIWTTTFSVLDTDIYYVDSAGDSYVSVIQALFDDGGHRFSKGGRSAHILNISDGSTAFHFVPVSIGSTPVYPGVGASMLVTCFDRSDNFFAAFQDQQLEQYYGAAQVIKLDIAGSIAAGHVIYSWGKTCMYIRETTSIRTDGTYVVVNGYREYYNTWSPNTSYDDALYCSEVYDAATGNLLQIYVNNDSAFHTGSGYRRHGVFGADAVGNGWLTYGNEIWPMSIGSSPAQHRSKSWSQAGLTCARIAVDNSSTWSGIVCDAFLNVDPLYIASCPGYKVFGNIAYDTGGSNGPYHYLCCWYDPAFGSTTITDCTYPTCYSFGSPSKRPDVSGGGAASGDEHITVYCDGTLSAPTGCYGNCNYISALGTASTVYYGFGINSYSVPGPGLLEIIADGAGGGGGSVGSGPLYGAGGQGGGGGGRAVKTITVTGSESFTFTCSAPGIAGGSGSDASGGNGGNAIVGGTFSMSAAGGAGGQGYAGTTKTGVGGTATGGDSNLSGTNGIVATTSTGGRGGYAASGTSGGFGGAAGAAGSDGSDYGGGGGGGGATIFAGVTFRGGAGGHAQITVIFTPYVWTVGSPANNCSGACTGACPTVAAMTATYGPPTSVGAVFELACVP